MPKSERKYRYRVSKKLFKYYNEQNYFMLNGVSRLISKYPFANLFSQEIFAIKNKRQEITEEFLISQVIPKYLNFFNIIYIQIVNYMKSPYQKPTSIGYSLKQPVN